MNLGIKRTVSSNAKQSLWISYCGFLKDDQGYIPFVLVTVRIPSFFLHDLIQDFVVSTWRVPIVVQELQTLLKHFTTTFFGEICISKYFVFCVVFCWALFVFCFLSVLTLYFLFFDLWLLISNFLFFCKVSYCVVVLLIDMFTYCFE